MSKIIDTSNQEELKRVFDGIRKAVSGISVSAEQTQRALNQFVNAVNASRPLVEDFLSMHAEICNMAVADNDQTEGQHHLELDETALESTGKSVSVDDVIANIDKALETDKE